MERCAVRIHVLSIMFRLAWLPTRELGSMIVTLIEGWLTRAFARMFCFWQVYKDLDKSWSKSPHGGGFGGYMALTATC